MSVPSPSAMRVQGAGGIARLILRLMSRRVRGNLTGDLARLAARLER